MTTNNNNITHYTSEDIARYWQGKMSAQEMHALESAAMDDPFLADALEGYSTAEPQSISTDVRELQQRLKQRTEGSKLVPLKKDNKWWRMAAALILLFGAGGLTYMLLMKNEPSQATVARLNKTDSPAQNRQEAHSPAATDSGHTIAATESSWGNDALSVYDTGATSQASKSSANPDDKKASPTAENKDALANLDRMELESKIKDEDKAATLRELSAYKKDTQASPAVSLRKQARADSVAMASNDGYRYTAPPVQRAEGLQTPAQANARMRNSDADNRLFMNNFSGRVVDHNNNAIPFASVRLNNNTQVASTTNDGYFQLKSSDTVIDLSVSSVGYQPRNLTLRSNLPTQDVVLERASGKMEEVVVTGYGAKKKVAAKESALNVYVMDAQPVQGWDNYNDYLSKNKRVDSAHAAIKGEVIVSFWVNKRGQLSDFAIERSLDKVLDAEAIRLVKAGPDWKVLKGKRVRARVIVTF